MFLNTSQPWFVSTSHVQWEADLESVLLGRGQHMVVIDFLLVWNSQLRLSSGAQQCVHVCELEGAEHIASKDSHGQFWIAWFNECDSLGAVTGRERRVRQKLHTPNKLFYQYQLGPSTQQ